MRSKNRSRADMGAYGALRPSKSTVASIPVPLAFATTVPVCLVRHKLALYHGVGCRARVQGLRAGLVLSTSVEISGLQARGGVALEGSRQLGLAHAYGQVSPRTLQDGAEAVSYT